MTTAEIIAEIDLLVVDSHISRKERIQRLRQLAKAYWKEIFPEYETDEFRVLTREEIHRRWEIQRTKNETANCRNKSSVMRVLDSPASGDGLAWVR